MIFYTYILQSQKTKRFYVGSCEDLYVRLTKHNTGHVKSTKNGVPWRVVFSEIYTSRQEAYKRERQIKSYKGGNAFKRLVIGGIT